MLQDTEAMNLMDLPILFGRDGHVEWLSMPTFQVDRRGPCAKCLAAAVGHLVDAKAWLPASQHVERSPGNWLSQRLGISKDPGGSDVFPPPPPLSL